MRQEICPGKTHLSEKVKPGYGTCPVTRLIGVGLKRRRISTGCSVFAELMGGECLSLGHALVRRVRVLTRTPQGQSSQGGLFDVLRWTRQGRPANECRTTRCRALMTEALAEVLVTKLNNTGHHAEVCELLLMKPARSTIRLWTWATSPESTAQTRVRSIAARRLSTVPGKGRLPVHCAPA
jgi:hypothetical protein